MSGDVVLTEDEIDAHEAAVREKLRKRFGVGYMVFLQRAYLNLKSSFGRFSNQETLESFLHSLDDEGFPIGSNFNFLSVLMEPLHNAGLSGHSFVNTEIDMDELSRIRDGLEDNPKIREALGKAIMGIPC